MLIQEVRVGPSVLIASAVAIVHVIAGGVVWIVPIPVLGKMLLSFLVAASLIYFMARDAALHAGHAIVALELRDNGAIACQLRQGEWLDCELMGSSYVSPQMTVVHLRPRGGWRTRRVILVPDNVDARDFRRLRMWLRWKNAPAAAAASAGES